MRYSRNAGRLEVALVTIAVGGPIALVLFGVYVLFTDIQLHVLMTAGDFLLIQPDILCLVFIAYGLFLFWLVLMLIYDDFYGIFTVLLSKLGLKKVLVLVTLLFAVLMGQLFFTYTKISTGGIEHYYGALRPQYTESWDQVKKAVVYGETIPNRRNRQMKLYYELENADGDRINLKDSFNFWDHILEVDEFLQLKKIPIERLNISLYGIYQIISNENYNHTKVEEIMRRIVNTAS